MKIESYNSFRILSRAFFLLIALFIETGCTPTPSIPEPRLILVTPFSFSATDTNASITHPSYNPKIEFLITPFVEQLDVKWDTLDLKCDPQGNLVEATVVLTISGGIPPYIIQPSNPIHLTEEETTVRITSNSPNGEPLWQGNVILNNTCSPRSSPSKEDRDHNNIGITPPVIDTTPPVINTTPPVINTTPPVIDTTPPVIDTTPPVIDTTPPVIDTTPPVIDTTPPVIDTTPPVIDTTPPPGCIPPNPKSNKCKTPKP